MNTLTIKVGQMPGKLVEVAVERGTSAREIFRLAGVEVSNHEVRLDGNKIDMDKTIEEGKLLVAMKMIKGNANVIKVGQMPGKLQEVVFESGMTAREIFELAEVQVSNHEVRLDGNKINLDQTISEGKLLVAMKMIKGNGNTIKVGMMPGKLQVIEFTAGEDVKTILDRADIHISNHEIRLDGNKVSLSDTVHSGGLLVAMKMIKGNVEVYKSDLTEGEIEILLGVNLPQVLTTDEVQEISEDVLEIKGYTVDEQMFLSIYELCEEKEEVEEELETTIVPMYDADEVDVEEVEHVCTCTHQKAIDVLVKEYEEQQAKADNYYKAWQEQSLKAGYVKDLIAKIQG